MTVQNIQYARRQFAGLAAILVLILMPSGSVVTTLWTCAPEAPGPDIGTAETLRQTLRRAKTVAVVARGDAQLSIQPVSEILHVPGVELLGPLPKELEYREVYAAAIIAGSKQAEAARRLIAFLSAERATAAIRKSGMEPSRRR